MTSHHLYARPRGRDALLAIVLAVSVVACGQAATPTPSPSPEPAPVSTVAPARPTPKPTPRPTPTPEPTGPSTQAFTVLVLGADRERRTDAVLVAGIDPVGKRLAFASIPRDTVNVPLPGGGTFKNQKINTFYNYAADHPETYPQGPARATADMVGTLLGIHIDYVAMTTFNGFRNIVKAMGGVRVDLPSAVVDPYYEVASGQYGVSFPAGEQTLDAARALMFVRTRKADNDFERQRRQQLFLVSAAKQVLSDPGQWPALLRAAANIETDFPLTEGPALILALGSLDDMTVDGIVLGPRAYEESASCTCGYALAPKVEAMREKAAELFPWAVAAP